VSELAGDGIPVTVSCRVLKLARAPYYRWVRDPIGPAGRLRLQRIAALRAAHDEEPEFGYRLLADDARDAGFPMADRTAWRLCSQGGIMSAIIKSRKKKGKKPGPPVHDDLIGRDFTAERLDEKWLWDITKHRTAEGKIYLCAIKDVASRRIVGYSISDRMKARLAVQTLENAVARRGHVAGCVIHSDRGSQFRSRKVLRVLERHGLVGSMGRVGAAGDNAAMESFFALLQKNVLDRRSWATREELRIAIVTWIERTHHRRRRQAALGRLTPIEFEAMISTPANLAA
jgi:putative transposase